MKHLINLVVAGILCSAVLNARTEIPSDIKFEKISVEQGLSQSSVFCICQDKRGFLWIGTLDGLNKYNGYKFTLYKTDTERPKSLSHNYVFTIFEDKEGELWIGTLGGGLNKFNRDKEEFEIFKHDPSDPGSISDNNIRTIFEDSRGNLWIGTNNGLNVLNRKTGKFIRYKNNPDNRHSISNDYIWSIYEDRSGTLYIGTYGGLNVFDYSTGRFSCYKNDPEDSRSISNNYIWSILEDRSGNLWIGTLNGLNRFVRSEGRFIRYLPGQNPSNSLSHSNVWKLIEDSEGGIWIATLGGGLNKIVKNKNGDIRFTSYSPDPKKNTSLSHSHVWSLFEDRTGILWIGTDVGLNKYDRTKQKFIHYKNNPFDDESLTDNEVLAIHADTDKYLWIGTRNGLDRYDRKKKLFRHFKTDPKNPNSISSNFIRSLYKDRFDIIWIGTSGGGLNRFDEHSQTFKRYTYGAEPVKISSNNVSSIIEDKSGSLWIGTLAGLNRFDRKSETFTRYLNEKENTASLSHDYISTLHEDRNGNLWIGTVGGGLNKFNHSIGKFERFIYNQNNYKSISNNIVFAIYEDRADSQDVLWIGTNDGLNKMNTRTAVFERFTEKDGLLSDAIYGILQDVHGRLWLSTNKGIACLDPKTREVIHFSTDDGLQSLQFSGGSSFKGNDGWMYFGGINGFNAFKPEEIESNPYIPPIVITDFQIFNQSVPIGKNSALQKSITETKEINLSYAQNVFSFEFAALHFSSPGENQFAYMLEGFDKNWIYTRERNYVTYTNLNPGDYVFRVKGSNNDGVWNETGTSVAITISPPFWMTWWFITASLIFLISVAGSFIYFRMQQLLAVERLRLKIARDLHDDIGTRLTEISMLSDMLYHVQQKDTHPDEKKTVKNIGSIARDLIDNMSEIVWLINPKRDSLYELILKVKDSYEEILSYSKIMFHINNFKFLEKIKLPMEYRRNLYLIFKEAINNILKHSCCTEISVNTLLNGNILEITIYDNGKGFDTEKECCGNGVGNMKARAEAIGGTLRINSKPGEGTMIKFTGRLR